MKDHVPLQEEIITKIQIWGEVFSRTTEPKYSVVNAVPVFSTTPRGVKFIAV
jgi:hypothetical protein